MKNAANLLNALNVLKVLNPRSGCLSMLVFSPIIKANYVC
jgi:membrane protein insertase Oxa1/YidC/SpoIIIJ